MCSVLTIDMAVFNSEIWPSLIRNRAASVGSVIGERVAWTDDIDGSLVSWGVLVGTVGAVGAVAVPLGECSLSREWCDVFPYIYDNGTWMYKVSQAVVTKSFPPNYRPPLLTVSNHVTIVRGVGSPAVSALPFGFWLVRFPRIKMISLYLSEEGTGNCRGESMKGAIKLGTCFNDSNFLHDSFPQFLDFPLRAVMFAS